MTEKEGERERGEHDSRMGDAVVSEEVASWRLSRGWKARGGGRAGVLCATEGSVQWQSLGRQRGGWQRSDALGAEGRDGEGALLLRSRCDRGMMAATLEMEGRWSPHWGRGKDGGACVGGEDAGGNDCHSWQASDGG